MQATGDIVLTERRQFGAEVNQSQAQKNIESLIPEVSMFGKQDNEKSGFSFKLTQVSDQLPQQAIPEATSPVKVSKQKSLRTDLADQMSTFESLLIQQKVAYGQDTDMAYMLNMLQANFKLVQQSAQKLLEHQSPSKSPKRKSPSKAKPVDENEPLKDCQVIAMSFSSPTKKPKLAVEKVESDEKCQNSNEGGMRMSQKRKRLAAASDESKFLDIPDASLEDDESLSPSKRTGKNCPQSPVKRMRKLEQQAEEQEAKVDVETAYRASPEKVIREAIEDEVVANDEQVKQSGDKVDEKLEEPKSLLGGLKDTSLVQTANQVEQDEKRIKIEEILDVDSNVINYGQFICGKILGSTLLLSNVTSEDKMIELNISRQANFDCNTIFGQYNRDELPFNYKDNSLIRNSEVEHNCWFIENPMTKELQKTITTKLSANSSQEFIIVVKAPKNRLRSRIVSFIDITLAEEPVKLEAGGQGLQGAIEKHVSHKSDQVEVKTASTKMDVLLLGYLDNPRIKCMKMLFNKPTGQEVINLAVKKAAGVQKFKLPFKNMSQYLDSDVEFAFIRTQSQGQEKDESFALEPIECLQFYCQPNQLKITADQLQLLTVQVKVNTELLCDEAKVDQRQLRRPLNKLLVARLKNSQVLFSYFVSITLVE